MTAMAFLISSFALVINFIATSVSGDIISLPLTGFGWDLWSPTASKKDDWRVSNVSLPGDVYSHLFEANKIPDPYFRDNDVKLRWISYENWSYQRSVEFPPEVFQNRSIALVVDGLDTIAKIYVNDVLVGNTSNMFQTYVFDIRPAVRRGNNSVRLDFFSPVNYSRDQALDHKRRFNYSVPLDCHPIVEHGECHVNFIRKMQSHFSWDWGPAFPTMGLNGGLRVMAYDTCFMTAFSLLPVSKDGRSWTLELEFWLYCVGHEGNNVTFRISTDLLQLMYTWTGRITGQGINRFSSWVFLETTLDLWWPNGLGNQTLYNVTAEFTCGTDHGSTFQRFGFRTAELVQEPIPNVKDGATFYLRINGVPLFLKGSNWVPGDSFLRRLTSEKLEFYFQSMKEANMNCIRVWGGGVYESDYFYELADQYGITLWHDMMFAVDLYPGTKQFLDNVKEEITDQINRLKPHPSIVIWAGNNENELGLASKWFPMDAPYEIYKRDYLALYNDTIYGVINATDFQSRPYVFSSPSNGVRTVMEGGLSKDPGSTMFGDVHYYNDFKDAWDWRSFPIPRCTTEFGYQSFPSLETLRTALKKRDLHYLSLQMLHRQHKPLGELEMFGQMVRQFKVFGTGGGLTPKFEHVVYLTQIHQAMAYKTEVEHYRRWRSMVNDRGEGLTMCALYWQLNDIWQAPSWASIDYGLKWKAAHYMAKKFFAPVLVSPYVDGENLKVAVVNDLREDLEDFVVVLDTYSWATSSLVYQLNISVPVVPRLSSKIVFEAQMSVDGGLKGESQPILFNTRILSNQSQELGPNNILFPEKFRDLPTDYFGKAAIGDVWIEDSTRPTFGLTIVANRIAPFVWLDAEGVKGYFSENAFSMVELKHSVNFMSWDNVTLDEFKKKLTVKTLGDLYRSGRGGV